MSQGAIVTKVAKGAAIALGLAVVVAVTYWLAVFSTSFDLSMCYSDAISAVSREGIAVAESQSPGRKEAYKALVRTLPLYGYETSCKQVEAAIAKYQASQVAK